MSYRRNGKLQACEPCRKGKLRCDHMMPHCGRCLRKGKTEKCVYHPAPLTKVGTQRTACSDQAARLSADRDRIPHEPPLETECTPATAAYLTYLEHTDRPKTFFPGPTPVRSYRTPAASTTTPLKDLSTSRSATHPLESTEAVKESCQSLVEHVARANVQTYEDGAAFISHCAILAENEPSIGLSPPELASDSKVSQGQIERGVAVLLLLRNLSSLQKYIDKWFSFAGGVVVVEPMVKIWLGGLKSTWHKILGSSRGVDLQAMSAQIWENTSKPLSLLLRRKTTPRDFCTNVTGANLRWEVLGILVTLVSLVAQSLKDGDPVFCSHDAAPVDRAALAANMYNASETCVGFCDKLGLLNDLYLWLLYENSIAYCSLRTRGSYDNWRKMSELAAALQCANLHQEIKVDDNTPFFMAELRKRLFICAYNNDKSSAAFAGRPPKLSRLYCQLQIPLDLTDTQIMSEGADLQAAIAELDDEGWNQDENVQRTTFARITATNALMTEEILEISLGRLQDDEIIRRAADIEARALRSWDGLPDFLRVNISDPWSSQRSPLELLFLVSIRLASLDHHYLLQRTLSKKVPHLTSEPNVSLLSVCSEVFQIVVMIVANKDFFRDFQIDMIHILATHGIPAAAVLAVELLHQEQEPASISAHTFPLHRSDTIQNLSVLVSCLGTVRADANGYQSCDRGKRFLKQILDLILGPGPAATRNDGKDLERLDDPALGQSPFELGSEGDFMRWLDEAVYDQDTWVNFT